MPGAVRSVFVVMPFAEQSIQSGGVVRTYPSSHYDDLYDFIRLAVAEADKTIVVDRMEQRHGNLVAAIIKRLAESDLVVAVLTGRNPNVFYELGVRHALRRRTIMLLANRTEYPFDLSGYFSYQYTIETGAGRADLVKFLRERVVEYGEADLDDSPVLDVLDASEREHWRALHSWETRRAALVLKSVLDDIKTLYYWCHDWATQTMEAHSVQQFPIRPIGPPPLAALRTFAVSYTLVGMPSRAYMDAALVVNQVNENLIVLATIAGAGAVSEYVVPKSECPDDTDEQRVMRTVNRIVKTVHRRWLVFAESLVPALMYVVHERRCDGIPWADVPVGVDEVIRTREELSARTAAIVPLLNAADEAFAAFELSFRVSPPGGG